MKDERLLRVCNRICRLLGGKDNEDENMMRYGVTKVTIAFDLMRGWQMLLLGLIGLGVIYYLAPDQLTNVANQQAKMFIAAYSAYWVDRIAFPYSRPKAPDDDNVARDPTMAEIRRAVIIAAALIMSGLNP